MGYHVCRIDTRDVTLRHEPLVMALEGQEGHIETN